MLATTKPAELGLPFAHWSLEDLAIQILRDAHYRDMSRSTIHRILNANDLKPHRCTQWLHSDDPDFEAKALHIARLYLDAPRLYRHGELVLCADEKTSIQALERKYPGRLDNMFGALQNVVKSHLADGTLHDFRNLNVSGVASVDGDKAFDEEEFPAPPPMPSLQVIKM